MAGGGEGSLLDQIIEALNLLTQERLAERQAKIAAKGQDAEDGGNKRAPQKEAAQRPATLTHVLSLPGMFVFDFEL